jgi:uncharacterized protein DUF6916
METNLEPPRAWMSAEVSIQVEGMQALSFEAFAGQLLQTFSLAIGESSVDLTLMEAKRQPDRTIAGLRSEPFTLYFKSRSQDVLPQQMYDFTNASLGTLSIFIVPVGREPDGVIYEAVFN